MPIDKDKLKEINGKIDTEIEKFSLLKQPRDIALIHVITHYERYISFEATAASQNIIEHGLLSKNAQDGIDFAIQWISKYCPSQKPLKVILKPKLLSQAKTLLEQAMEYSRVWDFMNLLFRDMCKAEIENNKKIIVEYSDGYRSNKDIINRFLNIPDDLNSNVNMLSNFFELDPIHLMSNVNFTLKEKELIYSLPDDVYIPLYKYELDIKKHFWELEETMDLGGYIVKDFRFFYTYMRAITTAHLMGCMMFHAKGKTIDNQCLIKTKDEWISLIKGNINVGEDQCKKIIEDLIFNKELYKSGSKIPDVTYQPFIPLGDGRLLLFNSIVQQSNYERNHWDLLSTIRPELHSRLTNEKESLWRNKLKGICEALNLKVKGPINFSFNGKKSDIDLVLIDDRKKAILIIEMKWITSPDRIKDIVYHSAQLKTGLEQVGLALEYIDSEKDEFANKIEINGNEINDYKILGLVLSKNSMGNGFTYNENIPIINERIFKWILDDPYKKSIEDLWRIGKEERYMPKLGDHYEHRDYDAFFAGYEFLGKNTGMTFRREFDPQKDFNFEGL